MGAGWWGPAPRIVRCQGIPPHRVLINQPKSWRRRETADGSFSSFLATSPGVLRLSELIKCFCTASASSHPSHFRWSTDYHNMTTGTPEVPACSVDFIQRLQRWTSATTCLPSIVLLLFLLLFRRFLLARSFIVATKVAERFWCCLIHLVCSLASITQGTGGKPVGKSNTFLPTFVNEPVKQPRTPF